MNETRPNFTFRSGFAVGLRVMNEIPFAEQSLVHDATSFDSGSDFNSTELETKQHMARIWFSTVDLDSQTEWPSDLTTSLLFTTSRELQRNFAHVRLWVQICTQPDRGLWCFSPLAIRIFKMSPLERPFYRLCTRKSIKNYLFVGLNSHSSPGNRQMQSQSTIRLKFIAKFLFVVCLEAKLNPTWNVRSRFASCSWTLGTTPWNVFLWLRRTGDHPSQSLLVFTRRFASMCNF